MIPERFKERMKELLGEEYGAFIGALESEDAVRGLRINLLKCPREHFLERTDLSLSPLPYTDIGFILDSDSPVGNLAIHHAGIIYMQDPGAMAPLSSVDIPRGSRVLDLCAAPGGKSTQAAAMIGNEGFLLSNEYVPKRAKITVGNFERLGLRSAMVTSMDTARLGELFQEYFDFIIADVPCSGEGMFRKNEEAGAEWSEGEVKACAVRSREILENAHRLLKPGGVIIYSTCTWSLEENEMTVWDFLSSHPDFHLIEAKREIVNCTRDGISYLGKESEALRMCRRFYPHVSQGEGQFLALLCRDGDREPKERVLYRDRFIPLTKKEAETVDAFLRNTLTKMPEGRIGRLRPPEDSSRTKRKESSARSEKGAVPKEGENIVIIPHAPPPPPDSVFMCGVLLGELKGNIITPSHQFFSAYGADFKRHLDLSDDEERLGKYLCGEEIDTPDTENGYCAVEYLGATVGGGKVSAGRVKNHYPKGLRN